MQNHLEGHFAWFQTSFGRILIAATRCGICQLGWEKNQHNALNLLCKRYPRVRWVEKKTSLVQWVKAFEATLQGHAREVKPPIDLHGTQLQKAVWETLRRVPTGQTISYKELAVAAGYSRAVRAVANACAQNPIALFIPCHRAVHTNASFSGYRWGKRRKQALLKQESLQFRKNCENS